ncbi:MAG: hypothetical protein ACT4O1_00575 [Gemmatimonadota bacterium]
MKDADIDNGGMPDADHARRALEDDQQFQRVLVGDSFERCKAGIGDSFELCEAWFVDQMGVLEAKLMAGLDRLEALEREKWKDSE